jgi:hypothetical protein
VETSLKSLIERFRTKPEWQHPDPAVRAEAVLRLPASEREILVAIAREDTEARVRRAAVKKLAEAADLAAIVSTDADGGVREEAEGRLAHLAVHEPDEAAAKAAVAGLRDARQLAAVAKAAPLAPVRAAAVGALADPRALASVVRESEDTPTRLLALARIDDTATLLSIALKTEHKAVAAAAVDRIADPEALRTVADKARAGAASRRARARLEAAGPLEATAPAVAAGPVPSEQDERERQAYEAAREAQAREAEERARELASRARLVESVEKAEGEAIPAAIEAARAAGAALVSLPGPEAEALHARLEATVLEAGRRHAAYLAGLARREELLALAQKAEELSAEPDLAAVRPAFAALDSRWREATAAADVPELRARFEAAAEKLHAREQALRQEHAQKDQEHFARLTHLAERAEGLLKQEETPLRDAEHALREIREALERPGHFPTRKDREQTLGRLEAARRLLYPRVQQLREDVAWKRWANVSVQEELCTRAEALLHEEDHEKAARELRDLDARWKQAKEAPKERAEALWNRFKAARDQVKARTDAFFAKQAEELGQNLRSKQALCERAEALAESTEWIRTAEDLRQLQAEWKQIGPVPRAQSQRLWERFRRPCDRFFTRWQEHRSQRSHEWAENLAKKEALCERAEALAESTDWETAAAGIRQLQAEWRTIGAVKKSRSEAVWSRFRAACDRFFDRYKNRDEHARQATLQARDSICADLESLVPAAGGEAAAPPDLVSRVQAAQTGWRQAGELPRELMASLDERFARVRDRLVEIFPQAFAGTDLDPEASRRKAEKLVARVEGLLQDLAPGGGGAGAGTAQDLAARLRDALAANTIGGHAAVDAKWHSATADVESAQTAWKRLGPMPGPEGQALAERFDKACRRFFEVRPRPERPPSDPRRGGAGRGSRPRS